MEDFQLDLLTPIIEETTETSENTEQLPDTLVDEPDDSLDLRSEATVDSTQTGTLGQIARRVGTLLSPTFTPLPPYVETTRGPPGEPGLTIFPTESDSTPSPRNSNTNNLLVYSLLTDNMNLHSSPGATSTNIVLPHPVLTKIVGKPTPLSLRVLKQE